MTHYDDAVRGTLTPDDAALYDALGRSPNPIEAAVATLRGDHPAFAAGAWLLGFAIFPAALYASTRFAEAGAIKAMIGWAAAGVVAFLALGFLKIWFFLEMQTETILRRLKRIELQLAARAVDTRRCRSRLGRSSARCCSASCT